MTYRNFKVLRGEPGQEKKRAHDEKHFLKAMRVALVVATAQKVTKYRGKGDFRRTDPVRGKV